mgnify:FL=1
MVAKETPYQIGSIGSVAYNLLSQENDAILFSIISRGIFIKFCNDKMIFLSFENYRGPITANLPMDQLDFPELHQEDRIEILKGKLWFPDSKITISCDNAEIWHPIQIIKQPPSDINRKSLIREFAIATNQQIKPGRQSSLHPTLLDYSMGMNHLPDLVSGIRKSVNNLREHFKRGESKELLRDLYSFLGLGNGLTPSGDDFVLGFFLSLNRWSSALQTKLDLSVLNQSIIEAAYHETTTISANLIECACSGLADERLIKAVDFLAVGNSSIPEVLEVILSWGNSSGVDALVGMMTAFLL